MVESYGRELFTSFVPPSARARAGGVPILSGALVARHGKLLGGPVLEVGALPEPALTGFLRAARHADTVVAVAVDAEQRGRGPDAPRALADGVIAAARAVHFDRPLILVARARPLAAGADVDRLAEGVARDLEAGFTSFGIHAAAFAGDVDALAQVCAPLLEQELGLELELDPEADPGDTSLLLASLDDRLSRAGLSLAAVRGASLDEELAGGLYVSAEPVALPSRLVIDDRIAAAVAKSADPERQELHVFEAAELVCERTGARGVASRLLDALAADL